MLARIWGDENCYTLGGRKCHCNTSQSATLCRWIVRALAPENSLTYGCCIRFLMLGKNNSPQRSSLKCHTFISSQPCRFEIRRAWLGSLLGLSRGQSHSVRRAGLWSGVLGRNPLPGSFRLLAGLIQLLVVFGPRSLFPCFLLGCVYAGALLSDPEPSL